MMRLNEMSFCGARGKLFDAMMLAALASPAMAMAAEAPASPHTVTANVGLVSDYLFRGISQTNAKPAIQGGFDYAHSSGWYAGVWGSSISWLTDSTAITGATSSQVELDTYFGFKNSLDGGFSYDVGFLRYNYPANYVATLPAGSAKADTDEVYGAFGYKWISAKYSHSLGDTFGIASASGTRYFEINASIPVADTGITFGAHLGKQTYKGTAADNLVLVNSTPTYTDHKVNVTRDLGGFVVGLAYSSTNANRTQYTNVISNRYLGKDAVVLSVTRSF